MFRHTCIALTYKQLLPLENGLTGNEIYQGLGGCLLTISRSKPESLDAWL